MKKLFQKVQIFIIECFSKIHWKSDLSISKHDEENLKNLFAKDYYIIATRSDNYFTTFLIGLGHFMLTGRFGFYSHVLMNLEDIVKEDDDYMFIEATGSGTHYSKFNDVFPGVDAVALIKPKNISLNDWTKALDELKVYLGRPYDNLFDLRNDLEINCVELIRLALKETPNYTENFAEFEKLISKKKKLTPDMFIECSDFEVVYKIKR